MTIETTDGLVLRAIVLMVCSSVFALATTDGSIGTGGGAEAVVPVDSTGSGVRSDDGAKVCTGNKVHTSALPKTETAKDMPTVMKKNVRKDAITNKI